MNTLQIFTNDKFGRVRTIDLNNKIYFVGNDVARALGYMSPKNAIAAHCKGGIEAVLPSNGGKQKMKVIPEGDLYRLVIKSQLPGAEEFESWIFDEVLPSIRETGSYSLEVKMQEKISNSMRAEVSTLINDIVSQKIKEIEEKCSNYYRPACKEKIKISKYIKNRLGIKKANDEYELVKERVLLKLNADKWEDVPIEKLLNSLNLIDESIRIIKLDRPYEQLTIFNV